LKKYITKKNIYKYKKKNNIDKFVIIEIGYLRIELYLFEIDSDRIRILDTGYSNKSE